MLLSITAKIVITANNFKHYESLGYNIPMKKLSRPSLDGRLYGYDFGKSIIVKVEDLQPTSRALVYVQCDICKEKKVIPYFNYVKGLETYGFYCCQKCKYNKAKMTNIEKYGTVIALNRPDIKAKVIQKCIEKYGNSDSIDVEITSIFQLPGIIEKKNKTMMEKYGTIHTMQVPEFYEKAIKTNLEKYGSEHPGSVKEFQEKAKQTLYNKTGYTNAFFNPEVREKAAQTIEAKYGTRNFNSVPEIRQKITEALFKNQTAKTSQQQYTIYNFYSSILPQTKLNYPIGKKFSGDIVIDNIDYEVDYGGHNLSVKKGQLTQEEFDHNQMISDKIVASEGYKIIRLIADKERKIPSDETLLDILNISKQYFSDYPNHSWIEWYIDNGYYRNAENKDGIPYDFGTLRKIKKADLLAEDQNQETQAA